MNFLATLTESKMLSSKTAYRKYTGKQIAELIHLHVMALRILAAEKYSKHDAEKYAVKSLKDRHFNVWGPSSTDLYLLVLALMDEDIELRMPEASRDFLQTLYVDEQKLYNWIYAVAHQPNEAQTRRLFSVIDFQLKISDSSMKAVRRLVMDWPELTHRERQLSVTRLLQMLRTRAPQSDLLAPLKALANHARYELHDVCDADNDECGRSPEEKMARQTKRPSLLAQAAAFAGGALLGGKLAEDDGGGDVGTTTADVAPFVKPLGKVRRRNPK